MPAFATVTEKALDIPEGKSDEEIWTYAKTRVGPVFHFAGTCNMGGKEDSMAAVDAISEFEA